MPSCARRISSARASGEPTEVVVDCALQLFQDVCNESAPALGRAGLVISVAEATYAFCKEAHLIKLSRGEAPRN